MGFLKNIFKKKPGGTKFGNLLRGAAKLGKTVAGTAANFVVPGIGNVINSLPLGEGLMMEPEVEETALQEVSQAYQMPPQSHTQAKAVAKQAKIKIAQQTGDEALADKVGRATYEAAAAPQLKSEKSEDLKDMLKEVLKGAADGAKRGAVNGYLNNTQSGQDVVKDATEDQLSKYLPYLAGGAVLIAAVAILKK